MSGHASDTTVAATLGTARRSAAWPASLPAASRPDADPTTTLLDALALGSALGRAGLRSGRIGAADEAAIDDPRPPAPARAADLLHLHLTQTVSGRATTAELLQHWLRVCADRGARVPHHLLVPVLERATREESLRPGARGAVGARGAWLAARNPRWSWFVPAAVEEPDWVTLDRDGRAALLGRLRRTAPADATALIASTWATDAATERRDHLLTLRTGLGPADEPLLERALDDRAASVRDAAGPLLDGLPGSRRAARMADRLRPLLATRGLLRRTLTVALPDDPDPAGVRDGLGDAGAGRSKRDLWLDRIAAGSPLSVWTDTALPVEAIVRDLPQEARAGVTRAVLARGDARWARALLEHDGPPDLLALLPAADAERIVLARIADDRRAAHLLHRLQKPWSPGCSEEVARRLRRDPEFAAAAASALRGMDPEVIASLADWLPTAQQSPAARVVRDLVQFHSALRTISEAFA